ncbi:hypothetical protein [Pedobacter sp. SYP-B3415]|uniref:hypothetical protein n=1 Tax=Pedobacter sp. SYP-B3415 TaxID=2496641 RepID=UPI00101D5536|nr:hypothetical protein [Pedobacter sp. SYP-B3415]
MTNIVKFPADFGDYRAIMSLNRERGGQSYQIMANDYYLGTIVFRTQEGAAGWRVFFTKDTPKSKFKTDGFGMDDFQALIDRVEENEKAATRR